MSIAPQPFKLTYEDYKALPEDKRVELIDGDFLMSPSPSYSHQRVSAKLGFKLQEWVGKHFLGEILYAPMDVVLSEHDVVQPDILFIAKGRSEIIKENCISGPPDLVLEILSSGHEKRDFSIKLHLYSKYGVREYWVVDPKAETITVFAFEKDRLELKQAYPKGSVVPCKAVAGFKLRTQDIF